MLSLRPASSSRATEQNRPGLYDDSDTAGPTVAASFKH